MGKKTEKVEEDSVAGWKNSFALSGMIIDSCRFGELEEDE